MNKQEIESGIFQNGNSHKVNKQEIEKAIEEFKINLQLTKEELDLPLPDGAEKHINEWIKYQELAISALEHQLTNGWIPVSSGNLPKCEERVFICADRKRYDGKIVQIRTTAMYEDGTMHADDSGFSWEDCEFEYDEESNDYIIPEGWYEQNIYCEEFGIVDDFVTHWMPLPKKPKEEAQ